MLATDPGEDAAATVAARQDHYPQQSAQEMRNLKVWQVYYEVSPSTVLYCEVPFGWYILPRSTCFDGGILELVDEKAHCIPVLPVLDSFEASTQSALKVKHKMHAMYDPWTVTCRLWRTFRQILCKLYIIRCERFLTSSFSPNSPASLLPSSVSCLFNLLLFHVYCSASFTYAS